MRKIFTLCLTGLLALNGYAQRLLTEDFNYATGFLTDAGGDNRSAGAWQNFSGTGNFLQVAAGNLAYPNYFTTPSPSSNKIRLIDFPTSSEDAYSSFAAQTTGTVYCSFILKLLKTDNLALNTANGEYMMAFLSNTSTSLFRGRLHVKQGALPNTFNIGINTTSTSATNPPIFAPTNFSVDSTLLVTFAYQYVAGASNDMAKLWVNKPFSQTEPVPDAMAVFPATGTEEANIARVVLRQAAFETPNCDIDAITIATTYAASLPLNLTSFTGSLVNKAARLNWTATNEVNVKGFAVEKGLNGKDFSEIAFVNAKNTNGVHEYALEDNAVKSGANYYRLKMVDIDGSTRFSQVVLVNSITGNTVTAFPNPAIGNVNLSHEKATRGAVIRLVSLSGKVLNTYPVQSGATQTGLSVGQLVKGNYILVFENNGVKTVTQFSKQ